MKPGTGRSNFDAGKRHGPFTEWHDNGAIAVQGRYEYGAKQGRFRHWHADRSSQTEFIYRNGRRVCQYKDGRKHGREIVWQEHGQKQSDCTWVENKLHGVYTEWHFRGAKR